MSGGWQATGPSSPAPRSQTSSSARPAGSDYEPAELAGDDVALLIYASGTTGKSKGAMNTHGNLAFNAETYVQISALESGEPILAVAPLFHITGMVGHVMLGLRLGTPIVITHRFHPSVMLEAIRRTRPAFTVSAITALMALADSPEARTEDFASLHTIYSGRAPIAPSLGDRLEGIYGAYVHNNFGMSETASPTHLVPRGQRAPADPTSGALSIGKPVYDTSARIVDENLADLPPGECGEIVITGPRSPRDTGTHPRQRRAPSPMAGSRPGTSGSSTTRAGSISSTGRWA